MDRGTKEEKHVARLVHQHFTVLHIVVSFRFCGFPYANLLIIKYPINTYYFQS